MLINGEWVPAKDGARADIINPANEEVVDSVPIATTKDLDAALAAADDAWKKWREVDAWTRSAVIRKISVILREQADDIADVLTEEQGKTIAESKGEVMAAADQFDWFADEARRIYGQVIDGHSRDHRYLVMRQAIGPVAAFSPWNFPILLSARKLAPALAAGCSIILKPAIEAPRTAMMMAEACCDAGVPPGVVNVVTGKSSMISEHLISSGTIRKVSLTGSVDVGKQILHMCADRILAVSMELGGHSPVIIFNDADIDQAAEICARGKFINNGQVCISASRFYVQEKVYEQFVDKFTEITNSLKLGNGKDPDTDVGPMANLRRLEATEELIKDAVSKDAKIMTGGKRSDKFDKGFYFEPTILTMTDTSMRVMTEEPFCPIAPITSFTEIEDALEKANDTEFGLAGYLFTQNTRNMFLASEGLDVGMVGVNNLVIASAEIPFGGVKQSGFGREGGKEGINAYTVTKYINILL
jgi:succinate-semialdehyde dehydrogenase / glutarate-semialdehyde dehydrogenase